MQKFRGRGDRDGLSLMNRKLYMVYFRSGFVFDIEENLGKWMKVGIKFSEG